MLISNQNFRFEAKNRVCQLESQVKGEYLFIFFLEFRILKILAAQESISFKFTMFLFRSLKCYSTLKFSRQLSEFLSRKRP